MLTVFCRCWNSRSCFSWPIQKQLHLFFSLSMNNWFFIMQRIFNRIGHQRWLLLFGFLFGLGFFFRLLFDRRLLLVWSFDQSTLASCYNNGSFHRALNIFHVCRFGFVNWRFDIFLDIFDGFRTCDSFHVFMLVIFLHTGFRDWLYRFFVCWFACNRSLWFWEFLNSNRRRWPTIFSLRSLRFLTILSWYRLGSWSLLHQRPLRILPLEFLGLDIVDASFQFPIVCFELLDADYKRLYCFLDQGLDLLLHLDYAFQF